MVDTNDRTRAIWWALTGVLALVVLFVLYAFVGTFVLGLFLYYAARPVYDRLLGPLRYPSLAATVSLFALALPAVLLFGYTLTLAFGELRDFVGDAPSGIAAVLEPYVGLADAAERIQTQMDALVADPVGFLTGSGMPDVALSLLGPVTDYFGAVLTGLVHVFLAIALAYYLLKDDDALVGWFQRAFADQTFDAYGRAVDGDLQTIYFGNILTAFLTGTIGAIVFYVLATIAPQSVPLPVPILLGLLTGLGSLVPVVGMKIVYLPVTLYLLVMALVSDPALLWFPVAFFVVTFLVVDTIPDIVLRPYVSGRNMHVGSVMFAYIFGSLLFGWYGIFLGPLLLVVIADFARIVVPDLVNRRAT